MPALTEYITTLIHLADGHVAGVPRYIGHVIVSEFQVRFCKNAGDESTRRIAIVSVAAHCASIGARAADETAAAYELLANYSTAIRVGRKKRFSRISIKSKWCILVGKPERILVKVCEASPLNISSRIDFYRRKYGTKKIRFSILNKTCSIQKVRQVLPSRDTTSVCLIRSRFFPWTSNGTFRELFGDRFIIPRNIGE